MADSTIDNLTAAVGTDLDDADLFLVLDGTNPPKKITRAELVKGLFGTGVAGDILYHNGTTWARLAKGTDTQIMTLASGLPSWASPAAVTGTWELISANTLTTTATAWTYTGLSAYDLLSVEFAFSNPSITNSITFQVRVSGGTWRSLIDFGTAGGSNDSLYGTVAVSNFARNHGARTFATATFYDSTSILTAGTVGNSPASSENFSYSAATGSDVTANDEIRFTCSTAFGAYSGVDGEINIYGVTL